MAQDHLEPLSALDASFLAREGGAAQLHLGAVARFDGPPPAFEALLDHVCARLGRVPRFRQRPATPPAGLGRPRWVDDPTFRLDYHVRHTALPAPGDEAALRTFVARTFSRRLDPGKPLWELWLVEGLAGDRFALVSKAHHALVDGVAAVDPLTALFEDGADPPGRPEAWEPRPAPTPAQLAADAVGEAARTALSLPFRAAAAAARPGEAARAAREAAAAVGEVVGARLVRAAPPSPLNVPIGPHRRVAFADARLADLRAVKDAFGGTVNDVILAAVAGALRAWLHHRGVPAAGMELQAGVPISVAADAGEDVAPGGRIIQVVVPLPVGVGDPVERLRIVRVATAGLRRERHALGAEVLAGAEGFAPPTILARAARLAFATRAYNVLVANVPGPQAGLELLGRRMRQVHPVGFLAGDRALAVAATSYDGVVGMGLIGDFDALADVDVVADALGAAVAELAGLARASGRAGRRPTRG